MRLPTRLLQRKKSCNKNDFGHVFVLACSLRYSGAGVLTAWAALRAGAGSVTLGLPKSINNAVIKIKPLEVMTFPLPETKEASIDVKAFGLILEIIKKIDVLALGPGLSLNASTKELVREIIVSCALPMVIDADALNALAENPKCLAGKKSNHSVKILTPHPKEMARLTKTTVAAVQSRRREFALDFARKYKVILVLKGDRTIVADYQGSFFTNTTGNPGMATAGSGDVLTGIISAFLAQGLKPFDAAKYAVFLHGLAGDLAAKKNTQPGIIASDIIDNLPAAFKRCSGK